MDARHTLKCDIICLIGYEIDVIDTLHFYTDVDLLMSIGNRTGNATESWILARTHMANERYQQNSHKWQTWQLGFQWHRRGIGLVFKSLNCFTVRLFHSAAVFCHFTRLITRMKRFLCVWWCWWWCWWCWWWWCVYSMCVEERVGWFQLQCIYYLVLYTDLKAIGGISAFQTPLLLLSMLFDSGLCMMFFLRYSHFRKDCSR